MSHPDPHLAEYVDGTLPAERRADVEAHIAGCARCRQEVALATAGRETLRTAADVPVPAGIADRAIAAAGAPTDLDAARARRPTRWLGAAAAVAAVVALVAVAAPKLGSSPSSVTAAGAGAQQATDSSFAAATGVEVTQADVRNDDLAGLAATVGGVQAPEAASGGSGVAPTFDHARIDAAGLPRATDCLASAFGDTPGTLTRVIEAGYEGTPAYLGFYAVGPGAGLPATRIQLLVASADGCRPLASAYALL